jgi:hypothetical protein
MSVRLNRQGFASRVTAHACFPREATRVAEVTRAIRLSCWSESPVVSRTALRRSRWSKTAALWEARGMRGLSFVGRPQRAEYRAPEDFLAIPRTDFGWPPRL